MVPKPRPREEKNAETTRPVPTAVVTTEDSVATRRHSSMHTVVTR